MALATFVAASDLLFILIAVPESLPERIRPASWGAPAPLSAAFEASPVDAGATFALPLIKFSLGVSGTDEVRRRCDDRFVGLSMAPN